MDKIHDVAVIVGSLRKGSLTRHVANALAGLAPATLKLSIIEIGHLRFTIKMMMGEPAGVVDGISRSHKGG